MLAYGGEWYWGIDRLPYLEAEPANDFGVEIAHAVTMRPESDRGPLELSKKPLACEMWFSFRSPYSAAKTFKPRFGAGGFPATEP